MIEFVFTLIIIVAVFTGVGFLYFLRNKQGIKGCDFTPAPLEELEPEHIKFARDLSISPKYSTLPGNINYRETNQL